MLAVPYGEYMSVLKVLDTLCDVKKEASAEFKQT
jgi:hypothetical protein